MRRLASTLVLAAVVVGAPLATAQAQPASTTVTTTAKTVQVDLGRDVIAPTSTATTTTGAYGYKWQTQTVYVYDASKYDVTRWAKQWNGGANIRLVVTSTPCQSCIVITDATTSELPAGVNVGGAAYITHDETTISACTAKVNTDIIDWFSQRKARTRMLANIITHEVGHCLGLDHSLYVDAVMFWQQNGSITAPTWRDFAVLVLVYGARR